MEIVQRDTNIRRIQVVYEVFVKYTEASFPIGVLAMMMWTCPRFYL